jgi:hypothetical protein
LLRQPEGKLDLAATSTYNASQANGDLQNVDGSKSHAILTETSEHSELRNGN